LHIATYTYDAANRLTVEQDTYSKYTLGYDNANRLTSVDNTGTPNAPNLVLNYGYDYFDNINSVTDNLGSQGATVNLTYDADNRLTNANMSSLNFFNGKNPSVTLAYDTASRLTSMTRKQTSVGSTITTTFGYDNADRLTGITHTSSAAGTLMTLTYGYDAANQLTSYNGPEGSLTYTYDVDGQLTNVGGVRIETYSYDKNGNRTMTGYTTGTGNRSTADGTYTYSYDNDGNMIGRTRTSDGQVTTFTYDYRNRLTEVLIKTSTGTTVQDDKFTYDVENRRIGKNTLSGGQSWTGYDGVNPYADFNSGGSLTYQYLYGNAIDFLLARVDTSGTTMWYLTDKLGSVREDVNTSGSVLDSITYDSYGNILSESSPSSGDRFKFTGREWDSEIGQYYYRSRNYAPGIGRFESEDPLGFAAGDSNLYRYVFNAPADSADPNGLFGPVFGPVIDPQVLLQAWAAQMKARGMATTFVTQPRPLLSQQIEDAASNIVAGFGDTVGCGLPKYCRQCLGMDYTVNYQSGTYMIGQGAGIAVTAATPSNAVLNGLQLAGNTVQAVDNLQNGNHGAALMNVAGAAVNLNNLRPGPTEPPTASSIHEPPASTPVGSINHPLSVGVPNKPPINKPTTINNTPYSGHAIDEMQCHGIIPSAVENTIQTGIPRPGNKPGTTVYYDPVNNITAVSNNTTGNVITVYPGGRR
jgi:RHS repeat-associated protein